MKLFLPFIALGVTLFPLTSIAAVDLKLDREVAPVVVNGEAVGFFLQKQSDIELGNGVNQLVIRVEKLVQSSNGEREKFNSKPVVLTFESTDSKLELSVGKKINFVSQAKEFDQAPAFVLKDISTGQIVPSTQEVLPNGGGITRDYEKELVKYNQKRGMTIGGETTQVASAITSSVIKADVTTSPKVKVAKSDDNKMILMQADFLRMSTEEQQKFLQWAVQNARQ